LLEALDELGLEGNGLGVVLDLEGEGLALLL